MLAQCLNSAPIRFARPRDKCELYTHLQHLQLLQSFLHQLLDLPLFCLSSVLPECVSCPSLGVFSEVVCCELAGLAEE